MDYDSDADDFDMDDYSEEVEIPISRYEILSTDEIIEQMESAIIEINSVIKVFFFYQLQIMDSKFNTFIAFCLVFQDSSNNNTYTVEPFEMGQTGIIGKIDRQQL